MKKRKKFFTNGCSKTILFPFLISAFLLPSIAQSDDLDSFFGDVVHRVEVQFSTPDFWSELSETHRSEEYISCDITIDGELIENVGIMLKGNSSFGHPGKKKSFKIKFTEYIDRDYLGLNRLAFSNGFKDPTFLREKLACDLFNAYGVPCLRATFAEVYYNREYWGFYTAVEPVNKRFLDRRFNENTGNLYKGDPRGDLMWKGADPASYQRDYEKKTNEDEDDWSDLIDFIFFLNRTPDEVFTTDFSNRFDLSIWSRYLAVNSALVNLDSYVHFGHNYYLYFTEEGKIKFIAWDLNEAFANFTAGFHSDALRVLPYDYSKPPKPLADKTYFLVDGFRIDVENILWQIIENEFSDSVFSARVDELADLIRPYVLADDNKMFSNEKFEANLEHDIPYSRNPIVGLKSFIHDRVEYLKRFLPEPTHYTDLSRVVFINEFMSANDSTITDEAGEYEDWVELYNSADSIVDISGYFLTDDTTDTRRWMFPDSTIIPAMGFLLIWCDRDEYQGPFHTNFKLSASAGEFVGLYSSDAAGNKTIDSLSFDIQTVDVSFGRSTDGSPLWVFQDEPTPGASNVGAKITENNIRKPENYVLKIYPNPFNNACQIEIKGDVSDGSYIEILDISGRTITRQNSNKIIWRPDDNLDAGIYLVRYHNVSSTFTSKIIYLK